jgi:ribonucleoside-diphosphate reductase alpha chain
MQAAIQPYVDNSISKTINVPEDFDFGAFRAVYEEAHALGLKGCTTFRPNPITGEVLSPKEDGEESPHCCGIEREAD